MQPRAPCAHGHKFSLLPSHSKRSVANSYEPFISTTQLQIISGPLLLSPSAIAKPAFSKIEGLGHFQMAFVAQTDRTGAEHSEAEPRTLALGPTKPSSGSTFDGGNRSVTAAFQVVAESEFLELVQRRVPTTAGIDEEADLPQRNGEAEDISEPSVSPWLYLTDCNERQ